VNDSRASGWLAGLLLGFVTGLVLLATGTIGLPFIAASVVLIAWKGPRLLAGAGLLTGLGLVWTVLFLRVALTCGPFNTPSHTCDPGDIWAWVGGSALIFAVGLLASAIALRRTTR
jgi:hypothetical protein